MRKHSGLVCCGIALLFALAWAALSESAANPVPAFASGGAAHGRALIGPIAVTSRRGSPYVAGVSAIQPRAGTVASAATPAITTADAAQYASTHGMPRNLTTGQRLAVTSAVFLSGKVVSDRLGGTSVGVPDSEIVCYVEMQGTFTFAGPRGITVSYPRGFEVFDAHTGNLLLAGGLR